jgi:hypothetical protein
VDKILSGDEIRIKINWSLQVSISEIVRKVQKYERLMEIFATLKKFLIILSGKLCCR